MPYVIRKVGKKYLVTKRNSIFGHVYGKHPTRDAAEKQIRAIEYNEHRHDKK